MSTIYKLGTTVIANRLKPVLDTLINEDQKGFIKGRFIEQNIRETYDILYETKRQNIPGLLLIDFEKAFDSVSWNFVNKVLKFFNFGSSIQNWITTFYSNAEACVIQNGHMSEFFKLGRGCRQGDPLSPYTICAEIQGILIRENIVKNIGGIHINNIEHKVSQYADDTQLFLDGTENTLTEAVRVLNTFYAWSGLKINTEKTKVIWIGSLASSPRRLCEDLDFEWCPDTFNILGVHFAADVRNIWGLNSDKKKNC